MADRINTRMSGKKITIHHDGWLFVNGNSTGIKQWDSDPKRWSNNGGQEIKLLQGMPLEQVLRFKGYI